MKMKKIFRTTNSKLANDHRLGRPEVADDKWMWHINLLSVDVLDVYPSNVVGCRASL